MSSTIYWTRFTSAVAAGLLCACVTPGKSGTAAGGLPDFELADLDGTPTHLGNYLGRNVVYLDFWASWCGPCQVEMPQLETLYQRYKGQGFVILGIAMDDPTTLSQVAPAAHRAGITFPVLLDDQSRAVALYNPAKSAPFGVLIDRRGNVVAQHAGYAPGDERALEAAIQGSF